MIMQVQLDDRVSRSIHRFVDHVAENAITWAIIVAGVAVVVVLLFTKRK